MDKIWDRKSFEVGGHWPLWRGWKNRMTTQNRKKSNAKKNPQKITLSKRFLLPQFVYVLSLAIDISALVSALARHITVYS